MKRLSLMLSISFSILALAGAAGSATSFAPSLYLWHCSDVENIAVVEGSVKVTQTWRNSYYCLIAWSGATSGGGYCGIQDRWDGHKLIFSVWDAVDMESVKNLSEAERNELSARIVYAMPGADASRFGGEGTGAHVLIDFSWVVGETVRIRVESEPDGKSRVAYTCSYYDKAKSEWEKVATISALGKVGMTGLYSFLEDFERSTESEAGVRRVEYSDFAAKAWQVTEAKPITSAIFDIASSDANKSCFDGGVTTSGQSWFLQNGGETKNVHSKPHEFLALHSVSELEPEPTPEPEEEDAFKTAHAFCGLVTDEVGMCGMIQVATAKKSAKGDVKVSGSVVLGDGKKQTLKAVSGKVSGGKVEVATKVGKTSLSLTITDDGFTGTFGDMTVASAEIGEETGIISGTLKMSYFDAKTGKVKTKNITIKGLTNGEAANISATVKGQGEKFFEAQIVE